MQTVGTSLLFDAYFRQCTALCMLSFSVSFSLCEHQPTHLKRQLLEPNRWQYWPKQAVTLFPWRSILMPGFDPLCRTSSPSCRGPVTGFLCVAPPKMIGWISRNTNKLQRFVPPDQNNTRCCQIFVQYWPWALCDIKMRSDLMANCFSNLGRRNTVGYRLKNEITNTDTLKW